MASSAQDSKNLSSTQTHVLREKSPDEVEDRSSLGADSIIGLELFHIANSEGLRYTEEEERRVLRKIDLHILPILSITYMLNYVDKTALNYANLFGMQQSLNLTSDQFSWLGSVFYFGFLIGSEPVALLLQRYHMGRTLGTSAMIWGIIVLSTAACKSFGGAMANRFFLGILDSVVYPCLVLQTGMWYRLKEQPSRQLWWYSFQGWAAVIGALVGYAVGHIDGRLPEWTWIFIILGAVTIVWGLLVFLLLPDNLLLAPFFSERERAIALDRVAANNSGIKNKSFKWYQIEHALRDPKLYILCLLSLSAQIPNGTLTNFSTVITQGIGNFTVLQTTLLGIPPNVMQVAVLLISGYLASRFRNTRVLIMTAGNTACVVATACLAFMPLEDKWARLVAFWITPWQSIGFSLTLVMVSANMAGFTKKTFCGAVVFMAYCVGNIIGPHFYKASEAPTYRTAVVSMLAGYCFKTFFGIVLGLYMWNDNRKRDKLAFTEAGRLNEKTAAEDGMFDRTEFENPGFRYSL